MKYHMRGALAALAGALALVAMALAVVLQSGTPGDIASAGAPGEIVPGRYIVVLNDDVANPAAAAADLRRQYGLRVDFVYQHALKGFSAAIPDRAVAALGQDARVAYVEPDYVVTTFDQAMPTGIDRIEKDKNPTGGSSVDVDIAIIDTGIDDDHPDLTIAGGWNCASGGPLNQSCSDGGFDDGNGHGTHVAGTAGANDNTIGVVGVAPGARLWAVRVLKDDGSGWLSWVIAGIDKVTDNSATIEVANMSLGCECSSSALDAAIASSVDAGVSYAVAAGNSNKDASTFSPANHPDVITVSAVADFDGKGGGAASPTCRTDTDDTLADFSNHGSLVEIAAPGVCILSTWKGGGYATISGTSMASPHVAGAAGLYIAIHGLNPTSASDVFAIRDALVAAALPQGTSNHPCSYDDTRVGGPLLFVNGLAFGGDDTCDTAGSGGSSTYTPTPTPTATSTPTPTDTPDPDAPTATPTDTPTPTPTASAATLIVDSITYAMEGGGNSDRHLLITVSVKDGDGSPASSVSVSIKLYRDGVLDATGSGTTGTNGTVTFKRVNAPAGCYTTELTSVTKSGYTWDGVTPPNSFLKPGGGSC